MIVYAKINKAALSFVRSEKSISYDYICRITKFSREKIEGWENNSISSYPTIKQAKELAKCYRVPFAGFYMNVSDIVIKKRPPMVNMRTMQFTDIDDSALNLAVDDLISARDVLVETTKAIDLVSPAFNFQIEGNDVEVWAHRIRDAIGLSFEIQKKCRTPRQLYLFIREKVEALGIFVHCFAGIECESVRGLAIYDDEMPIIGVNEKDRYPAKSFTILHELVHIIRKSTTVCNDMNSSFSQQSEEVFCNAVAGMTLVPRDFFLEQTSVHPINNFGDVEYFAKLFSVSKEVIARRMLDYGEISKDVYISLSEQIHQNFIFEKQKMKEETARTGKGIPKNVPRDAIDRTSPMLSKALLIGYQVGRFDKQDVSRFLGIKQKHVSKYLMEVATC